MKRLICLILMFGLCLCGCSIPGEWIKEPVTFYYVRDGFSKDMESVIASEVREASGHRNDLPYLLALYSMGPTGEDLTAPFPKNITIIPIERNESSITLTLSENMLNLSDAEFTLSGTCIAMTCMELTDTRQVVLLCGDKSITIGQDNLLLYHQTAEQTQEETK